MKEKEGKTESKEKGNKVEGKRRIRGEENRKVSNNAAVVSVSCVPRSGPPDWPAKEPRLPLHHDLSFRKDTFVNKRILL